MKLICVVLFCVVSSTHAGWLKDLVSKQGLALGNGLFVQLKEARKDNGTFFERHALKVDYGGYGLSVKKSPKKDALEFGFSVNDGPEGRGKDKDNYGIAMILGYKLAAVVTMTLSLMGAFVLKALAVAKIALITSAILLVSKLFHHHEDHGHHHAHHLGPAYVEIDHGAAVGEYIPSGDAYGPSASSNYYTYTNYVPSGMGQNAINYINAEPSSNSSDSQAAGVSVARRRDSTKRKTKFPLLTIHRYSVET